MILMLYFEPRKHKALVHLRFAEFLLDLRLEDVQLILHVPINVGEALLRSVVVGVLTLFVSESRHHTVVVLLNFGSWILATFIGGW